MSTVSIIVAIYNIEEYLKKCLDSLRVQTFSDITVYCVNDGSKDGSKKIVEEFCAMDSRFVLVDKPNGGLSDARNYALKDVTSKYVMFIDGDDFVQPDMVECALKKAEENDLDLVVFDYNQYYLATNTSEVRHIPFDENKVYSLKDTPTLLCYVGNSAWNKLYRTALFHANGIEYPKGYVQEDLGTTPKLLYLAEKIGFVSKPLYNYLIDRPNNITQEKNERIYHILKMCESFLTFYKEKGVYDRYYEELKYLASVNILLSLKKLPYFTDKAFVNGFIKDTFAFLKRWFPDFPKCKYLLYTYKEDRIYLNPFLLKMYLMYKRVKG